ncbi:Uncharacterized conserved protein [Neisseria zoodegmatis]|uniref:Uncharacterized conserved protein n=1 Tax=Neisseria zoodegmatis TaxID=326523 RepID=A0A378WRX2_9NEIS|nr:PAAR domain-containing protein [Neisseria zoodegmatis]SUA43879.1 Uncharacterized conserved protein [Neisseria zoodegmatis]
MPTRKAIVVGDSTTHGGTVIEGSHFIMADNKNVALMGDKVHCPKCKGVFPIIEGSDRMFGADGRGVALEGMRTACGANLIGSQSLIWVDDGQGDGSINRSSPPATKNFAETGKIYADRFLLKSEHNIPYKKFDYEIKLSDGSIHTGITDEGGHTQTIKAGEPLEIVEINISAEVLDACCSSHAMLAEMNIPNPFRGNDINIPVIDDIGEMVSRSRKRRVKIGFPKIESSRLKLTLAVAGKAAKAVTRIQKSRSLTQGEIDLAKQVFKDSIDYAKVKVHKGEYLLWVQDNHTAMTPNGEMYFPEEIYQEDFTVKDSGLKHFFIHEMVHIWQYQLGYDVKASGAKLALKGGYVNGAAYKYDKVISQKNDLSEFNMEQQGDIIADYYMYLNGFDFNSSVSQLQRHRVLTNFLNNSKDKSLLPTSLIIQD